MSKYSRECSNWDKPDLEACDASDGKQKWTCSNRLVRDNGTILSLNFGSSQPGITNEVVLSDDNEPLSFWSVFGAAENICTKQSGMYILK